MKIVVLPVIYMCVIAVLYLSTSVTCRSAKHQLLHKQSSHNIHSLKRRSTTSMTEQQQQHLKKFHIPISSFVDDVSEATAFRDREKKLKAIASNQGELLHSNDAFMKKRKYVSYPVEASKQNDDDDNSEEINDSSDDVDSNEDTTTVSGSKKQDILKDNNGKSDKTNDMEDEVDDRSENDADEDESSGSGDNKDENMTNDDNTNKNNDNNDEDENTDSDESDDDTKSGSQRSGEQKCHRKCSIPLTFHKCAFPRCSKKMGTIKDLCFYLCKHQKEKCEDVCE